MAPPVLYTGVQLKWHVHSPSHHHLFFLSLYLALICWKSMCLYNSFPPLQLQWTAVQTVSDCLDGYPSAWPLLTLSTNICTHTNKPLHIDMMVFVPFDLMWLLTAGARTADSEWKQAKDRPHPKLYNPATSICTRLKRLLPVFVFLKIIGLCAYFI